MSTNEEEQMQQDLKTLAIYADSLDKDLNYGYGMNQYYPDPETPCGIFLHILLVFTWYVGSSLWPFVIHLVFYITIEDTTHFDLSLLILLSSGVVYFFGLWCIGVCWCDIQHTDCCRDGYVVFQLMPTAYWTVFVLDCFYWTSWRDYGVTISSVGSVFGFALTLSKVDRILRDFVCKAKKCKIPIHRVRVKVNKIIERYSMEKQKSSERTGRRRSLWGRTQRCQPEHMDDEESIKPRASNAGATWSSYHSILEDPINA